MTVSKREQDITAFVRKLINAKEENYSYLRREYVELLGKYNMIYHFDEPVKNICWDVDEPNVLEAAMLDNITDMLYSEELFDIVLSLEEQTNS